MAPFSALFAKLQRRLLVTSFLNYCKIREEDGKKTFRKYFAFFKQGECCYWKFVSELQSCFPPKTVLFDPVDDYHDTITDGLKIIENTYSDARFEKTFRVSKATFRFILCCIQRNLQRRRVLLLISLLVTFNCAYFSWSPRNSSRASNSAKIH